MKTTKQLERDKRNGVANLKKYIDHKTGMLVMEGDLRQEFDMEVFVKNLPQFMDRIAQTKDKIADLKKKLAVVPEEHDGEVLKFIELQKKAKLYLERDGLADTLKTAEDELVLYEDDMKEQKELIEAYEKWKKAGEKNKK